MVERVEQKISRKKLSPFIALSLNVMLAVILFVGLNALSIPLFFHCAHPFSQTAVLALGSSVIFQLVIGVKILPGTTKLTVGITATLILLALWLGSYPYSPFGFSTGRIPVLRGFMVTTRSSPKFALSPGELFTLISGSPAAIEPVLLTGNVTCAWSSSNGGSLDNPNDCNIAYYPPQAEYDILKIRIQPACGLPESSAQIKVSILP